MQTCECLHVKQDYDGAAELLKALAHPMRLRLVHELESAPHCVHELVEAIDAPQPLVSQHLRVLRDAGLVTATRQAREVHYALTDEHVLHIALDAVRHAAHA